MKPADAVKFVDVIIAVHTPTRPIGRAVASVLDGNGDQAQVTIVCHNIAADQIAPHVEAHHRDRVTWVEHHDGIASAAGPFNAGMRSATAEFVSIMGSDDTLDPGAIASWLSVARATEAECVMSALVIGNSSRYVPTPPVRPRLAGLRSASPRLADVVRDRLSYRSAPLGLVSTAARSRLGAELVEGMPVGDDVPYVTRLWCETKVAVDRGGPAYRIGVNATDRLTYTPRSIADEVKFVWHLIEQPWFAAYLERVQTAVATKVLRIHLFGAVFHRSDPTWWTPLERAALSEVTQALLAAVPSAAAPLSIADDRLLTAMKDVSVSADILVHRANERRRHGRPTTLIPRQVRHLGHREAPPRFMAASWLASR